MARRLADGSLMVVGTDRAGMTSTRYESQGGVLGTVVLPFAGSTRVDIDAFGRIAAVGQSQGRDAVFLFDGVSGATLWPLPFALPRRPGAQDILTRVKFTDDGDVIALCAYGPANGWDVAVFRLSREDGGPRWAAPAILAIDTWSPDAASRMALTPRGDVVVSAESFDTLRVQVFDGASGASRWAAPAEYAAPTGYPIRVAGDPGCDRAGNVFVSAGNFDVGSGRRRWATVSFDGATGGERWRAIRPTNGLGPWMLLLDGEGRALVTGEEANGVTAIRYSAIGVPGPEVTWPTPDYTSPLVLGGAISEPGDDVILFSSDGLATRRSMRSGQEVWGRRLVLNPLGPMQGDRTLPQIVRDGAGSLTITAPYGATEKIDLATGADVWPSIRTMGGALPTIVTPDMLATRPNGDVVAEGEYLPALLWRFEVETGALAPGWPVHASDVFPRRMVVDRNGDVAVLSVSAASEVVITKFDGSTGMPKWNAPSVLIDLSSMANPLLLEADPSGDFLVAGQGAQGGIRVVKVRGADGSISWSLPLTSPSSGSPSPAALVVDAQGDVELALYGWPDPSAESVVKLRGADGTQVWPTPFAVTGGVRDLRVDNSGFVFVASFGLSQPGPLGVFVYRVLKLDGASATPLWTRDLAAQPLRGAMSVGPSGDVFIAGTQRRWPGTAQDYLVFRLSGSDGTPQWPQPVTIPGGEPLNTSAQILSRPGGNVVVHVAGTPASTRELDAASGAGVWGPLPEEAYGFSSNIALTPDGVVVQFWSSIARYTTSIAIDVAAGVPRAECGAPYAFTPTAPNSVPPLAWSVSAGSLPAGITLDLATGLLSGSSSQTGSHPFRLRVSDGSGAVAERDVSIEVVCDGHVTIAGATTITCGGAGESLSVPGTWSSYLWLPGGETTPTLAVNPRARSSYGVVVTDTNRCTYRGSADVDVLSPPSPVVTAPPWATVGEKGLPASIPFHAGSQYSWAIQNGTVTSGLGTNAIVFTAGEQGTLWLASTETNAAACSAAPAYASVLVTSAPMALQTVTPCRLLDTRNGSDGPRFRGGETRLVPVPGRCGIPAIARALVLNVTAVQADLGGSVVVVPGDAPSAAVNTVSFGQGQTRASMAIVSLAVDGSETIAIWNTSPGGVDVLLDVSGWFE